GTSNHPVLVAAAPTGVPMLLWSTIEELQPGDRIVMRRGTSDEIAHVDEETYQWGALLGAFVSEGFLSERRAGFNNTDQAFFDDVVEAYDRLVGGPRYTSTRTTVSGKTLHEL